MFTRSSMYIPRTSKACSLHPEVHGNRLGLDQLLEVKGLGNNIFAINYFATSKIYYQK